MSNLINSVVIILTLLVGLIVSVFVFIRTRSKQIATETVRQKALARIKQQRDWNEINTFSNTKAKQARSYENAPSYFQYTKKGK